jgi:hypothetical protein
MDDALGYSPAISSISLFKQENNNKNLERPQVWPFPPANQAGVEALMSQSPVGDSQEA